MKCPRCGFRIPCYREPRMHKAMYKHTKCGVFPEDSRRTKTRTDDWKKVTCLAYLKHKPIAEKKERGERKL